MIEKYVKEGKVAVLVSYGFGAGWSTWNTNDAEMMLFCPQLVELILSGASKEEIISCADKLFPQAYKGGLDKIEVDWVEQGVRFEIEEYDGSESIRVFGPCEGFVA